MNMSLFKDTGQTQSRPTIAQLHEAIKQACLWQSKCKADLKSDFSSAEVEIEIFNQLLQEKQLIYQND